MLQHLLNTTAIWLLSLVLFDAILRKETFHTYNRIYLLSTFLLGIFLPLWTWGTDSVVYQGALRTPIEDASLLRENILHKAMPVQASISWEYVLGFVYVLGVIVSAVLLAKEIYQLIGLYRNGSKTRDGQWTIIETGQEHTPFSLFKYIFVNDRNLYDSNEWAIICRHEEQHGISWHFIDLFIIQLSRVFFWFHPLVYIYNKRLLLIHEYQADSVASVKPSEYGQFLIEQALLQPAPSLSHSFNRSPIKKRIIMLSHKTSSYKHFAKLLVLPLLAISLVCCTKSMYSVSDRPVRNGDLATYRGNSFAFSSTKRDTVLIQDPVTKETMTKVVKMDGVPVKMNDQQIFSLDELDSKPAFNEQYKSLREYLLKNMKNELTALNDGSYKMHVDNAIIDENGKLVYFEYSGITRGRTMEEIDKLNGTSVAKQMNNATNVKLTGNMTLTRTPNSEASLDENTQKILEGKAFSLLQSAPRYAPGTKNGKGVVCAVSTYNFWNYFKVQNHQLYDFDSKTMELKPL